MKVSKSLLVGDLSFNYTSRSQPALGLIVSRRYGNSVSRNLFKRRCRSIFRNRFINKGALVALIIRPNKQNISFMDIDAALGGVYEKICS
jgi:ribonuclease P protein component